MGLYLFFCKKPLFWTY